VVRKNTKRPTAVQRHVKSLRLPADLAQQIDRWAKAMGEDSHSEAMRHLFEIGLSAADRSAPMPIAPVPQGDLRGVAKPKTGIDPFADEQPGGLDCPDRPEDKKLWLRVPTPSAHRSELWKGAMRPPRVTYDWNPIESAPLDEACRSPTAAARRIRSAGRVGERRAAGSIRGRERRWRSRQ
jgi:hypothetical protein